MQTESGIVLVTGANGRIGAAVMRRLRGQFSDVVGFDRAAATPPPPDCVCMPVDITSDKNVRNGLDTLREHHGQHIVSVIHLAAYYDFLGRPSPKYDEITAEGTRLLLQGVRQNFKVEQFVFASTMLVHTEAVIHAFSEVARSVRFIHDPFGLWLVAAAWLLDGTTSAVARWAGVMSGVALIALAIPRGPIKESYAGWDRYIV